jgi:hypothetical protein
VATMFFIYLTLVIIAISTVSAALIIQNFEEKKAKCKHIDTEPNDSKTLYEWIEQVKRLCPSTLFTAQLQKNGIYIHGNCQRCFANHCYQIAEITRSKKGQIISVRMCE